MKRGSIRTWFKKYKKKKIFKKIDRFSIISLLISFIAFGYALSLTSDSCLTKHQWCGQDMDQYLDYSDNLLSGHGYSAKKVSNMYFVDPATNEEYIPEVLRLPSYPLLITLGRIFYNDSLLILFFNFTFYIFILFYSYKLLRLFLKSWFIPISLLFIAFNPTLLFYTAQMGSADTFSTVTVLGFIYHTLKVFTKNDLKRNTILASLFGVLVVMSRQNMLLFILPFLFLSIFYLYRKKKKNNTIKYLLIILASIILVMSIWIGRSYILTGKPVISAMSGMQLFSEHVYFATEATDTSKKSIDWLFVKKGGEKFVNYQREKGKSIDQAYEALDAHVNKLTLEQITSDPLRTLRHYYNGIRSFYTGTTFSWEKEDVLANLKIAEKYSNKLFIFVFLAFPFVYFFKKDKNYFILVNLWLSSILFIYISAFFHGTIIGNRGLLPVITIQIVICFLLFSFLLYKIVSFARKNDE